MKKFKLANGLTVIHQPTKTKSVTVEVMVGVGSNDERSGIRGISHFIEHMLFEGTKKRINSSVIAAEIEDRGGEFNAYTTTDRTAYYIKILNKHTDKALDVLSDMLFNSTFEPKFIEKEKKVILKEIHMVLDDPRFYKWILFQQALFRKHPSRHPTYGKVKDVNAVSRQKILDYYTTHYVPKNMTLSIVGDVKKIKSLVTKHFSQPKKRYSKKKYLQEPKQQTHHIKKEKRKTNSTYTVLGFHTCSRNHSDSYALDVLDAIHGKGQSGRMFEEIRNKHGLAYEVGVECELESDVGYFAVHASTDPKQAKKARQIMIEQCRKPVSAKEVKDAKTFIEGNYLLDQEDTQEVAEALCYWEHMSKAEHSSQYLKRIKKVTHREVIRVQKKYFSKHYIVAEVGPK